MKIAGSRYSRMGNILRWLLRIGFAALALLVLGAGLAILNNNFSFSPLSRDEFVNRLDQSLAASTNWTIEQYSSGAEHRPGASDEGKEFVSNPALAHMLVDCASTSDDPRLKQLAAAFIEAYRAKPSAWSKMVDPNIVAYPLSTRQVAELQTYQRWILHSISPADASLSATDLEDMFSPSKNRTGKATHQLFSLYMYRKFHGETPALQQVMNRVEDRIATEAALDFRVTDLYLQRIAFLLAAARPDLVKPRWVERALSAQQSDGGWHFTWYGWDPTPYRYTSSYEHSVAHTTAQGMWIACMLKHRYPEWIGKHYK